MANDRQTNYFVRTLLRARDWQHRPEFDHVCDWWRDGGRGVCALVGMGGAGKTAIVDRFLNELLDPTSTKRERVGPGGSAETHSLALRARIAAPNSVFVYSFYDDDKPENFFRHLQTRLGGTSAPDKQKPPTQRMFDIQQHRGPIILDGLERVQESSVRSIDLQLARIVEHCGRLALTVDCETLAANIGKSELSRTSKHK